MSNQKKLRLDRASFTLLISLLTSLLAWRDSHQALAYLVLFICVGTVKHVRFPGSLVKTWVALWVCHRNLTLKKESETEIVPRSPAGVTSENLLSIVIVAYNSDQTIAQSIRSAFAQTRQQWELVVVDDGSTDGTLEVSERLLRASNYRYRILSTENRGPGAARNLGLEACQGDFVSFLDADDYYLRNFVEEALNAFEKHSNFDAGIFRFLDYREKKNHYSEAIWSFNPPKNNPWLDIDDWRKTSPFSLTQPGLVNKVFRRSMIEKSGVVFPNNRNLIDDLPTTYYWLLSSRRVWGLGRPLSVYRRKKSGLHTEHLISAMDAGKSLKLTAERLQDVIPEILKKDAEEFLTRQTKFMSQDKDPSWRRDFLAGAGDLRLARKTKE